MVREREGENSDSRYRIGDDDLCAPDYRLVCELAKAAGKRDKEILEILKLGKAGNKKTGEFDPYTKGANSIKAVLPAILKRSKFLQKKYSKPIYGNKGGIPSFNFENKVWLKIESGKMVDSDPYKELPKMFQDVSDKNMELMCEEDELRDGGAAMTAYARSQFEEMSDYEWSEIKKALLKYCELDTLAMVMIYEGWKDLLGVN